MHPAVYRLRMHMRPGELKFLWKRSYYWNTAWRKFKHSYFGLDTIPHVYYLIAPFVYSFYMVFSDLFYHPDIDSSWMLPEPFKSFFDNQGAYRQDYYQEGMTYRLYDHAALAFGIKGRHRTAMEAGLDVNCPTSPMYGRRVLRSDDVVPFEPE